VNLLAAGEGDGAAVAVQTHPPILRINATASVALCETRSGIRNSVHRHAGDVKRVFSNITIVRLLLRDEQLN
jgi:hypothetical protein